MLVRFRKMRTSYSIYSSHFVCFFSYSIYSESTIYSLFCQRFFEFLLAV